MRRASAVMGCLAVFVLAAGGCNLMPEEDPGYSVEAPGVRGAGPQLPLERGGLTPLWLSHGARLATVSIVGPLREGGRAGSSCRASRGPHRGVVASTGGVAGTAA
jgi:hypothetical protein